MMVNNKDQYCINWFGTLSTILNDDVNLFFLINILLQF